MVENVDCHTLGDSVHESLEPKDRKHLSSAQTTSTRTDMGVDIIMVPAFIPRLYPRNKPLPAIEVSASNNSHVEVRFPAPAMARVMDTSPNRRFEYSHLASKVCVYTQISNVLPNRDLISAVL
jgi:hypothetical protein